jgi:hypothetical protein
MTMTLDEIDTKIAWHTYIRNNLLEQDQRAARDEYILRLMQIRMEITRQHAEEDIARGLNEHRNWYDTSKELE